MKAFKITAKTALEELTLSELPEPTLGPGEVLVRLRAAALNHRDLGMFDWAPDAGFVLGADGVGVIAALGAGVEGWAPSAEVIINPALNWGEREDAFGPDFSILGYPRDGTFAEAVVVPATNLAPKPLQLSWEEAAALPLGGLTTLSTHASVDVETLLWHQLNLLGSTMGSPRDFASMLEMIARTSIKPIVDSIWPLADGRRALQHLAQGRQFGKIVLQIN